MSSREMIGLDTNILVYADDPSSSYHLKAREYLQGALQGSIRACLSHQVLAEYYSVVTSEKKVKQPLTVEEARERLIFLNRVRAIKKIYSKRSTFKRSVEFCAKHGIVGVRIFDALYAMTLLDNGINKLITRNVADFESFKDLGLEVLDPFKP